MDNIRDSCVAIIKENSVIINRNWKFYHATIGLSILIKSIELLIRCKSGATTVNGRFKNPDTQNALHIINCCELFHMMPMFKLISIGGGERSRTQVVI